MVLVCREGSHGTVVRRKLESEPSEGSVGLDVAKPHAHGWRVTQASSSPVTCTWPLPLSSASLQYGE